MIISKTRVYLVCFAFVFAAIAFLLNPGPDQYDLARHYSHIDNLQGISFSEVIEKARVGYLLFDGYAWIITSIGLPKNLITATVVFVSHILVFSIWYDLVKVKKNAFAKSKQIEIVVFLVLWLSINFISIASGIRNGFGNVVVFYVSYHLYSYNRRAFFFAGATTAFFIHPFTMAASLLVLLAYIFGSSAPKQNILSKIIFVIALLFLAFRPLVVVVIEALHDILVFLPFYKPTYLDFDSEWGAGHAETRNFNGLLEVYLFRKLPVYIASVYLLFVPIRKIKNSQLFFLLSILFLYFCLFFDFYTLVGRMTYVFTLFFSLFIVSQVLNLRDRPTIIFALLYLSGLLVYSVFNLYAYRNFFITIFA